MTVQLRPAPLQSDSSIAFADGPRLLADVGGTNARFALETAPARIELIEVLPCAGFATLADALRAYLASPALAAAGVGKIRHAAIAIANPVVGDLVRMTNHHWEFSIAALQRDCGFETLLVENDFSALARALPHLAAQQKRQVGGGAAPRRSAGFRLRARWPGPRPVPHVSAERLMSGIGLELVYRALAERAGVAPEGLGVPGIIAAALAGRCPLCVETVACFCEMLGTLLGVAAMLRAEADVA